MESPRTKPDLENRKIRYRTGIKTVRSKGRVYTYPRVASAAVRSELDGWRMDAAKALHKTTSARAVRKGRIYELSVVQIFGMLKSSKDQCQITSMGFDYRPLANKDWRTNPFAPSLDRIDNRAGYTPANVRLVCSCVNYAINEFGLEVFEKMCRAFVERR